MPSENSYKMKHCKVLQALFRLRKRFCKKIKSNSGFILCINHEEPYICFYLIFKHTHLCIKRSVYLALGYFHLRHFFLHRFRNWRTYFKLKGETTLEGLVSGTFFRFFLVGRINRNSIKFGHYIINISDKFWFFLNNGSQK